MVKWRAAVGLEVHAQIASLSKLFSRGATKSKFQREGIQLFDVALPGTLPVSSTHVATRAYVCVRSWHDVA